jgi:hypothetical protein
LQLRHILKLQGRIHEAEAFYLRAVALDPLLPYPLDEVGGLDWSEAHLFELRRIIEPEIADAASSVSVNIAAERHCR